MINLRLHLLESKIFGPGHVFTSIQSTECIMNKLVKEELEGAGGDMGTFFVLRTMENRSNFGFLLNSGYEKESNVFFSLFDTYLAIIRIVICQ